MMAVQNLMVMLIIVLLQATLLKPMVVPYIREEPAIVILQITQPPLMEEPSGFIVISLIVKPSTQIVIS